VIKIDRCLIDANWGISTDVVKQFCRQSVHARLCVAMGDRGCLSLFDPPMAQGHRLLAEQLTSEFRVKTTGRGRTVDEWKIRTPGADNHWLDCLVGCGVAASMQGAVLFGTDVRPKPVRRMKLSELQKLKAMARR
jgi:hypothetical protein